MNNEEYEVLFKIGRVLSKAEEEEWLPTIQIIKQHDHYPAWTAALMYLLLDKYLMSVDDDKQEKYFQETMKWFEAMREGAHEYIDQIDNFKNVE